MEKVLIIAKMGNELTELHDYLHNFFRVLTCTETTQNASAMLNIVEPDIVITLLSGVYDVDMSIFDNICKEHSDVPVLAVGARGEYTNFVSHFSGPKFENLMTPIDNEGILFAVCRRLKIAVPPHDGSIGAKTEKPEILLVDDNAMTLRSIKSLLDDRYSVTIANSGMKALAAIGKKKPDLILLDYEMPICDGRQTLEMIRADEDMCDIPVIFLTGVNDREHVEAVLKLKPSGYLLKPPIKKTLIEAIESVIDK